MKGGKGYNGFWGCYYLDGRIPWFRCICPTGTSRWGACRQADSCSDPVPRTKRRRARESVTMTPELIADYACACGEGPLWHPEERVLYWLDIPTGRLFRYDPADGSHSQVFPAAGGEGEAIGGFTLQADGTLLLFGARGRVQTWQAGQTHAVIDEIPDERDTRFNDVIADPEGRVFCGTMSAGGRKGRLYRLDPDHTLACVLEGVGTSNGMGFTPDGTGFYHTDSDAREIRLYNYDRATGAISNGRVFVRTPDDEGVPDGMTVDADGTVWCAKWDGGCLIAFSPAGRERRRVAFPARKVSCITFGGADYADAYVTCAGGEHKDTDGPGAGALFRVDLGVKGVPEFRSRIEAK